MRIKIWTVYIKTKVHATPIITAMEYCYKMILKIRSVLDV